MAATSWLARLLHSPVKVRAIWPQRIDKREPPPHSGPTSMLMRVAWVSALLAAALALLAVPSHAYTVGIKDKEGMRQACSGMYAGKNTSIDGMFRQC